MAMKKKTVSKKPKIDSNGNAENTKDNYRLGNRGGRAAQSGYFQPPMNSMGGTGSREGNLKAWNQGARDAGSRISAPSPRTGPSAGGQSSLYARLTGGGLKKDGR